MQETHSAPTKSSSTKTLPLVILGGRDRQGSRLPASAGERRPLEGYKSVDLRIGDRRLIEVLLERLRAGGDFEPIFIAGPKSIYEPLALGVQIVDTDSGFGANLRAGVETAMEACPGLPLAIATGDILPDPDELRAALDDLHRHSPCDFWMPQFRVPEDSEGLGESAWKPRYWIQPEGEDQPVPTLPGHLIVADPAAVRRDLLFRIFDLTYRTRNQSIDHRRSVLVRKILGLLLREDLKRLFSLRRPGLTWDVAVNGLRFAARLKAKSITQRRMEDLLRRVYLHHAHRRRFPDRRGRVAILRGLSLAKDIDTAEEAREVTRSSF